MDGLGRVAPQIQERRREAGRQADTNQLLVPQLDSPNWIFGWLDGWIEANRRRW